MPSVSQKQHNLMAMVANNPAAAKRVGIPQSVGKDFVSADKGMKFRADSSRAELQKVNRPSTRQGKSELFAKGGDMKESKAMVKKEIGFMKKAGAPKSMIKHEMGEMKMAKGGMASMGSVRTAAPSKDGIASKGKTKGKMVVMKRGGKAC
jgi:hypothetical protein